MTENSIITTTEYLAGGFQYKGAYLQFFPHAEGYVNVVDSHGINNYNYVFNYTDHLGNIRVSYGVDPETQSLKILEENHYYAFGLKHTNYNSDINLYIRKSSGSLALKRPLPSAPLEPAYQYKYNGKELQTELGLNMYDMDLRDYDPAIGRWINQDPVVHYNMSPYSAFDNNPVLFADPSGADSEMPGWMQDLWNNSGSGTTKWTNDNDGFFTNDKGISIGVNTQNQKPAIDSGSEYEKQIKQVFQKPNQYGCSWAVKKSTDMFFGIDDDSIGNEKWLEKVSHHGASIEEIFALYESNGYNVNDYGFVDIHEYEKHKKEKFDMEKAIEWMANEIKAGRIVQIGWEPGRYQHNSIITRVRYDYETKRFRVNLMNPSDSKDALRRLIDQGAEKRIFQIYSVWPK